MSDSITYAQLHAFLRGLGFQQHSIPDSHEAFVHSLPDTIVLLALHDPNDEVLPHDLIDARVMTVKRGLISNEGFEQFLSKSQRMPA